MSPVTISGFPVMWDCFPIVQVILNKPVCSLLFNFYIAFHHPYFINSTRKSHEKNLNMAYPGIIQTLNSPSKYKINVPYCTCYDLDINWPPKGSNPQLMDPNIEKWLDLEVFDFIKGLLNPSWIHNMIAFLGGSGKLGDKGALEEVGHVGWHE